MIGQRPSEKLLGRHFSFCECLWQAQANRRRKLQTCPSEMSLRNSLVITVGALPVFEMLWTGKVQMRRDGHRQWSLLECSCMYVHAP